MHNSDLGRVKAELSAARMESCLSNSEISRRSNVHRSQVGLILDGNFLRISENVIKIALVLGVEVFPANQDWRNIQNKIADVWDGTTERADFIIKHLEKIPTEIVKSKEY